MCRLMTHRRSVKIGLEFWNRIRNDKYEVRSKYEQIWANMSKYEVRRTSWSNGEKGDWGLEIGSGVLFVLQMFFYLTILKVLFIFKSAQPPRCNVPCDQDHFHLIKILKYIVIIDWNTYIVIIQLCVYELRMLSPIILYSKVSM